jgi:hypothetical protein
MAPVVARLIAAATGKMMPTGRNDPLKPPGFHLRRQKSILMPSIDLAPEQRAEEADVISLRLTKLTIVVAAGYVEAERNGV